MDFGALPPEINSVRMYTGAGSAPMMAAASAWKALAAELTLTAAGYERVITTLHTEEWMGPASASMFAAAAPYITWLSATAAQAEHAASQAQTAAAAYEAAFAGIVPPPLIAANRAELASLRATNLFGCNSAAIANIEAQYGEMWAHDAMTMYRYADSSASASALASFTPPPNTTNPAAAAMQTTATVQAAAGSAQSILSRLLSEVPSLLQNLASPVLGSAGATPSPGWLQWFLDWYMPLSQMFYNTVGLPYFGIGIASSVATAERAMGLIGPEAEATAAAAPELVTTPKASAGGLGSSGQIAASAGNGSSVGKLSVPPTWAGSNPQANPAPPVRVSNIVEPPDVAPSGNLLGGMPLAGPGAGAAGGAGPRYGVRPIVMTRPPFAG